MNKEKNLDWMSASSEDVDLVGNTSILEEKDNVENSTKERDKKFELEKLEVMLEESKEELDKLSKFKGKNKSSEKENIEKRISGLEQEIKNKNSDGSRSAEWPEMEDGELRQKELLQKLETTGKKGTAREKQEVDSTDEDQEGGRIVEEGKLDAMRDKMKSEADEKIEENKELIDNQVKSIPNMGDFAMRLGLKLENKKDPEEPEMTEEEKWKEIENLMKSNDEEFKELRKEEKEEIRELFESKGRKNTEKYIIADIEKEMEDILKGWGFENNEKNREKAREIIMMLSNELLDEIEKEIEFEKPEEMEIIEIKDQKEIEKMNIKMLEKKIEEILNSPEFGRAKKFHEAEEKGEILKEVGARGGEEWRKQNEGMYEKYNNYLEALEKERARKEKIEAEKPETTREILERLKLLEKLEMFEKHLKLREIELAEIEKYINEKIKNEEEITQEDEARRKRALEEVQKADINITMTKGVALSLSETERLDDKIRMQELLLKQYEVLGKMRDEQDRDVERLSKAKKGAFKKHWEAVVDRVYSKLSNWITRENKNANNNQQTGGSKKKLFERGILGKIFGDKKGDQETENDSEEETKMSKADMEEFKKVIINWFLNKEGEKFLEDYERNGGMEKKKSELKEVIVKKGLSEKFGKDVEVLLDIIEEGKLEIFKKDIKEVMAERERAEDDEEDSREGENEKKNERRKKEMIEDVLGLLDKMYIEGVLRNFNMKTKTGVKILNLTLKEFEEYYPQYSDYLKEQTEGYKKAISDDDLKIFEGIKLKELREVVDELSDEETETPAGENKGEITEGMKEEIIKTVLLKSIGEDNYVELRKDLLRMMTAGYCPIGSRLMNGVSSNNQGMAGKLGEEVDRIKKDHSSEEYKILFEITIDDIFNVIKEYSEPVVFDVEDDKEISKQLEEKIKKRLRDAKKVNKGQFEAAVSGFRINEEKTVKENCEKITFLEELFVADLVNSMSNAEKEEIYKMKAGSLLKLYEEIKKE